MRIRVVLLLLLLAAPVPAGCAAAHESGAAPDPTSEVPAGEPVKRVDTTTLVAANTEFAVALFEKLRAREGNLFFSPASISAALAMVYAGARGETAAEMARTLRLPEGDVHAAYSELLGGLDRKGGDVSLSVANALWAQRGFAFREAFLKTVREGYRAEAKEADFAGASEEARRAINAWVEQKTQEKIKELFKPGVLTPATRLVLANAIYFKGKWAHPFDAKQTAVEPFLAAKERRVDARMMRQKARFRYFEDGDLQALEMPYAGDELAMTILLPRRADGIAELERSLTAARLAEWLGGLAPMEVAVSLPRFTLTSEFSLADTLSDMGMQRAFGDGADFSGMSDAEQLALTAVVHKAWVDVNEEGTEAAAATGGVVSVTSVQQVPVFRADHPFLFLIRDARTGYVLFAGRVANPGEGGR